MSKAVILLNQFGKDAERFVASLNEFRLPYTTANTEQGKAIVIDEDKTLMVSEATAFDFNYGILSAEKFNTAVAKVVNKL